MKVKVEQGREEGQVIARINGAIALFPKRERNPAVGSEVEVMITGYKLEASFEEILEGAKPRMYFVRLVRPDDRLIEHSGFECSGSMCSTTAYPVKRDDNVSFLTPSRVGVYYADNVNTRFYDLEENPLVKGLAYVKDERGARRIEGVPNIEQLEFWVWQNNEEVRRVFAANKATRQAREAEMKKRREAQSA